MICLLLGLRLDLFRISNETRQKIGTFTTNDDGRVDAPILSGDDFRIGTYELLFYAGDYLDAVSAKTSEPKFLDVIPLRFAISDDTHYHVPLLLSPFGYSTYRGS